MEKIIKIGEAEVLMVSNALTPIKYRSLFKEDLFNGLAKMDKGELNVEVLSRLAYCMAIQGDSNIKEEFEEWLCKFEMMEFYHALTDVLTLWADNNKQTSTPKKAKGK